MCRPAGDGPTASSTARSTAVARGLLAAGIGKGDRVGIWSPNCAEWVFVQYATARVGAILVNINPAYRSRRARSTCCDQSGIRMLVAGAGVQDVATTRR